MSVLLVMWVIFALGAIFVCAANAVQAPQPTARIGWTLWFIAAILLLIVVLLGASPSISLR